MQAVAVGGNASTGAGAAPAVGAGVLGGEGALPDVHPVLAAGLELGAPGERLPDQATAGGVLPLVLGRQPGAPPRGVRLARRCRDTWTTGMVGAAARRRTAGPPGAPSRRRAPPATTAPRRRRGWAGSRRAAGRRRRTTSRTARRRCGGRWPSTNVGELGVGDRARARSGTAPARPRGPATPRGGRGRRCRRASAPPARATSVADRARCCPRPRRAARRRRSTDEPASPRHARASSSRLTGGSGARGRGPRRRRLETASSRSNRTRWIRPSNRLRTGR